MHLFGYSDGAIVALHVALQRPDVVRTVVFASAVVHYDAWLEGVLAGDPPEFMAEAYGQVSPDGVEHWPVVVEKARRMHVDEPAVALEDLARLTTPVLVVAGDDEMRLAHLVDVYRALPYGELAVLPRATHGMLVEQPELLAHLVRSFHSPSRGPGVAPIRRTG